MHGAGLANQSQTSAVQQSRLISLFRVQHVNQAPAIWAPKASPPSEKA
jgi:hypothetical protein